MSVDGIDRPKRPNVGRRGFLKGAALGGVAAVAAPAGGTAQTVNPEAKVDPTKPRTVAPVPRSEESTVRPEGVTYSSCGGDYMVDVMRSVGIEYFAATPGN